jgi:hypothetical protein
MAGGMLGAAGYAVAEPEPAAAEEPTYTMPDIEGMSLDSATQAIKDLNPDLDLVISDVIHFSQKPLVLSNWKVCWQYPDADEEIDAESWLGVGVTRKATECW